MLKKGEHIEGTPAELQALLDKDAAANSFFQALAPSHKRAYCDWVGSAKQEATRHTRAGKALLMLQNKQKTLKTV
ncbi:MAG: YdeI/OmpD-associated family protein [Chitinophagaceae bacterium]